MDQAIALRPHQADVYERARTEFEHGKRRVLIAADCGFGKSYIFAKMAANATGPVLIIVHRRELLEQHAKLFNTLGINTSNIRIAMVQTEANRLGKYPKPSLIILDECHLSLSNSWMKIIDFYDAFCVGFTATPIRLDGKPLGDVYDSLVTGVDTKWLIDNGYLAPFEYYAPTTVDADSCRKLAGDYVVSDIERLMMDRAIYGDVLNSYKSLCDGEKAIAYCVSVAHAKQVSEIFKAAGYASEAIDGSTPKKQRQAIMGRFRVGNITVLCNCALISEGVSIDDVNVCMLLRPTASHALFWQQAMRCMRYLPGKTAKILDFVGNYTRNPIPSTPVEWSLDKPTRPIKHMTDSGDFAIRTCPSCFKVFPTAAACPYCETPYPLHPREIAAKNDIELQRIGAAELEAVEAEKKRQRIEVGRCRTLADLRAIQISRGYKPSWVYMMARAKGIKQ